MKRMTIRRAVILAAAISLIASGCQKASEDIVLPTVETSATTTEETSAPDPEETDVQETTTTAVAETTAPTPDEDEEFTFSLDGDEESGEDGEYTEGEDAAARTWSETSVFGTMYIVETCYSRERAVLGSTPMSQHFAGDEVSVVAVTDTQYYKLSDGSYIHMDYLSTEKPVTTAATTEPLIITTEGEDIPSTEPVFEEFPDETEAVTTAKKKKKKTETLAEEEFVTPAPEETAAPRQTEKKEISTVVKQGKYTIDFSKRYAYKSLSNDAERALYAEIVDAVMNMYISVDIPEGMDEYEAIKVYAAVLNNEPELFWMSGAINTNASGTRLKITYNAESPDEIKEKQAEIDKLASKLVTNSASLGTVARIKYYHDYIIKNAKFSKDSAGYNSSVYNGLTSKGKLQCAGYAKTMSYLLDLSGIESITVVGANSSGSSHAWNVVYCDNGYYNLDCTWDDPVKSGEQDRGSKYISYTYFLVPDSWFDVDHFKKNDVILSSGSVHLFDVPKCTATSCNYFDAYGKTYSDLASAKAGIKKEIKYAVDNDLEVCQIRVTDEKVWNTIAGKEVWSELQNYARSLTGSKSSKLSNMSNTGDFRKTAGIIQYDLTK